MQELLVLVTPLWVPCSSSGDPTQNPAPVTLQVGVLNIAGVAVDLTGSALRFDLVIDPGGDGSAGALILSSDSVAPSGGVPTPLQTVQATAVAGTNWSINPSQDGAACTFLAIPEPGAGIINAQESISFTFANLLVDLMPGPTPITVTVIPAPPIGQVTTTPPAYVTKTAPGVGITSFTATPILVPTEGVSAIAWTTIGVAACALSWHPDDGAVVTYNGAALSNPASGLPVHIDGAAPVVATLNAQTQFTLSAQGVVDISDSVVIGISEPALSLWPTPAKVLPSDPLTLQWSAFNTTTPPSLSWNAPGVVVIDDSTRQPIVEGSNVSSQGSATVQIIEPTEFLLQVARRATPTFVNLFVLDASISVEPSVVTSPTSQLPVTIKFKNAVGLVLTTPNGSVPVDFVRAAPDTEQTVQVLVPFFNQTFEYVLAAKGYAGLGQPDGLTRSATATAKVQLSGLTATPSSTVFGTPTVVTLRWESYGARGFQLSGHPDLPIGTSAVTVMQTTTGNYTLTALGDTLGDPLPTLSIDVPANPKGKDKEKEKEKDKEKEHKEKDHKEGSKEKRPPQSEELQFTAFRANIPAELRGTQRAFIGEELRPEPATEQPSGN